MLQQKSKGVDRHKMKKREKRVDLTKQVKINYDADIETDTFDYFKDDDPFKSIKIT